jgi:hypothetical protein
MKQPVLLHISNFHNLPRLSGTVHCTSSVKSLQELRLSSLVLNLPFSPTQATFTTQSYCMFPSTQITAKQTQTHAVNATQQTCPPLTPHKHRNTLAANSRLYASSRQWALDRPDFQPPARQRLWWSQLEVLSHFFTPLNERGHAEL